MLWLPGVMLTALLASNLTLQRYIPSVGGEVRFSMGQGVTLSMQCALRCKTSMYATDCTTSEGARIIKESLCRDLVHGLADLGAPIAAYSDLRGIFRQNGWANTMIWLIAAPLTYLTDTHSLEVGLFRFGEMEGAMRRYSFVKGYYAPYFDVDQEATKPSRSFTFLEQWVHVLFHRHVYHG